MAETDKGDIPHFQVATITAHHPKTGDKIERSFIAQAFFTPKQMEGFGDIRPENLLLGWKMLRPHYSDHFDMWVQDILVTLIDPDTGKKVKRSMIGKAFFTPEELKEFAGMRAGQIFSGFELRKPYNPMLDDTNIDAQRYRTKLIRESLDQSNDS